MKEYGYVFVLILLLSVLPAAGQKSKADKLFADKQYYAAAQIYEKEADNAKAEILPAIQLNTGICYLNINRPQTALPWLELAAKDENAGGEVWYQYGLALQQTGEYHRAISAFEQCLKLQIGRAHV